MSVFAGERIHLDEGALWWCVPELLCFFLVLYVCVAECVGSCICVCVGVCFSPVCMLVCLFPFIC